MFGRRFFGKRFFGSHYFGPANAQGLSLSGIASVSALGLPVLSAGAVTIRPPSITDADAFGSPTVAPAPVTISATGFADVDAFGAAAFHPGPVTLTLSSFSDGDALGHPVLQAVKKKGQGPGGVPGGVAKGQKYGTRIVIDEPGLIIALESVANVTKSVNTRMGLYADSATLPAGLVGQSAVKTSVVSGSNRYTLETPRAVLAGTALWPTLHSDGNFSWFLNSGPTSRFNADAFNDGLSNPFGASTAQGNKAPIFVVLLEAIDFTLGLTGVASANAFGSPSLALNIAASGFADGDGFGSPSLSPQAATLSLSGFVDSDEVGLPILSTGAFTIRPPSIETTNDFGAPSLVVGPVTLTLAGIADVDAFGTTSLALPATTISLTGFLDVDGFGSPSFTVAAPFTANPFWELEYREPPIRELDYGNGEPMRQLDKRMIRELA